MTPAPRFYLLDTLRGLAALAVVVWHYQHFFFVAPGTLPAGFDVSSQPFYSLLEPLYLHGYLAVALFFCLSGFIFFLIYGEALALREVGVREFFVLRFSRLYPLHFVTLLAVALGQHVSWRLDQSFIVYPNNDAWHFVLHLFFASDWGFQSGLSFNSPVWSVSIEVLIYALFFVFARFIASGALTSSSFLIRASAVLCAAVVALVAQKTLPNLDLRTVATGAACFFLGGLAFVVFDAVKDWPVNQRLTLAAMALALSVLALIAYVAVWPNDMVVRYAACPPVILAVALFQSIWPEAGRATRVIGDITYSTYLIHFPLQIAVLLAIKAGWIAVDFTNPLVFLAFLSAVIALAIPVYKSFELPMQKWLRRLLLEPAPAGASRHSPLHR